MVDHAVCSSSPWTRTLRLGKFLIPAFIGAMAATTLRADLVMSNYTASRPLKIMPSGDSITDDCSINGAWRLALQPILQTNGYAFTNLGRWISTGTPAFTKTHHEGICGAVIAYPGKFPYHNYVTASNYAQLTLMDALTNAIPDLFLIDLGVNDIGYGRDPWLVATNHMAALLDMIFARVPTAHIIVGKPTSITYASIGTPLYSDYGTNMPIYCAALQSMVNARRAQGQNVYIADLFSAVSSPSMMQPDGTHPSAGGFNAMAKEWFFRITTMTVRTDMVVTPFIAAGTVWKYNDQGQDLGTNWAQLQYDDSNWAQGLGRLGYTAPGLTTPVSYGNDPSNRYMTTYFRRTFNVPANLHYTNLSLRLNRADGAVVWLNGKELLRTNMPAGSITFSSHANSLLTGDTVNSYYPAGSSVRSLPAGTNLLAVEIHKVNASATNLSFDLELFGSAEFIPTLSSSLNGTNITVRWPATNHAGYILVSGTNLLQTATWAPCGGPYVLRGGAFEYAEPVITSQPVNFYMLRFAGLPSSSPSLGWSLNSNTLSLSWPANFAGFNLETSTGLPPDDSWQTVAGPYLLSNNSFGISVSGTTAPQQFFRLRKPIP